VQDPIAEDVLAAAQRGDGDAFSVIWRELSPAVAGYLAARGATDPDGMTSDVFLALLPRLSELTGGVAGLRTFVFSIAHARMVDDARRRARRPATVEFDPVDHDRAAASAEHEALTRVSTQRVLDLLDRLSPDYREVLALRVVADLGVEQTAAVMQRSAGSVKQLQRRALLALRAELETVRTVTGSATNSITDLT
jgi:RNA polymerase sigma-70 factor (ECF subfamily)